MAAVTAPVASKNWLKGIIFFIIYFLVGELAVTIHASVGYYPMIWFPSGLGLGILVVWGEGFWPILALAAAALSFSQNHTLVPSLIVGTCDIFGCVVGSRLLKHFTHTSKPRLWSIRETLVFLVLSTGVGTLLSASLSTLGLFLIGTVSSEKFYFMWKLWWFSEAMGNLILGAAIICLCNDIRGRIEIYRAKMGEYLFLCLAICATTIFIYTPLARYNSTLIIRPYVLFPLMILFTLRFDTLGVVTVNILVMVTMLIGSIMGVLPTGVGTVEERMFIHQLIAMTLGMTGFVIAAAIREREDALQAKNEFISLASHELKTPLTSLKLQIQMAQWALNLEKEKGPVPERVSKALRVSDRQILNIEGLVESLLDVIKIRSGKLTLRLEEVHLAPLIRETLERFEVQLRDLKMPVHLNIDEAVVANWDKFRIEQVIVNLVSNAIKYAPGRPLEIASGMKDETAWITVVDHGPGIPKEKHQLIFERFERLTPSKNTSGLGLGLFIVKQIVEAHFGSIEVQSQKNMGSKFIVKLPRHPEVFSEELTGHGESLKKSPYNPAPDGLTDLT